MCLSVRIRATVTNGGGEIQLKGGHNGLRWDASYSLARVVDDPGVAVNLNYEGSAPEHHFRLLLGYTAGPWEVDANGQYVTSTNMFRSLGIGMVTPTSTSAYESLSGRIAYRLTDNITAALSGSNLTRANTQESPYPAIERRAFLTLTGKF